MTRSSLYHSTLSCPHPHNAKRVLDASLLFEYLHLDINTQVRMATLIGTTPAQIIENFKTIAWSAQMH